ncbi:NAD(P)/FAD-dependent oxidoreductase [Nocardioides dongxiaopingii]|uniref:NAD(P)/FAD-dependent oxidoreductase n=1 Tax=Nocardioides dongxiaopingii TaxID=2576036 RepID=UPI0010C769BC|nr:FAD-binding oxidoreductase [Nocardioides dongxiaopingii]
MSPRSGPANGEVSFWWSDLGRPASRPSLPGDTDVDVCVVGAGFTGLWTAYYLKRADPTLRVVVLESRFAGFGASGRNGGWLTNSVTGGVGQYVATHGRDAAVRQQRAMNDAVAEVVATARAEGIDADIRLGGELNVARTPAQLARLRSTAAAEARWPGTDWQVLSAGEAASRVDVAGVLGAMWHPHCARIHPAKLVSGLAEAVERLGVVIHEDTHVEQIRPGVVETRHGRVRAGRVVRATEGFTARLPGERRTWLPMNSSLVVTEPLPDDVWAAIGWEGAETLGDLAHVYMYAQRTADGRIALGGRGVPYRFGSRLDTDGRTPRSTVEALTAVLHDFFPAARGVPVAHAWSGVLGVPRDWSATVGLDRSTGVGYAGGYVGTGVTSTNLAGRTLADLVLDRTTDLTTLPWVGHRARRWEPEPLRWLGVSSIYAAYRSADRAEGRGRATTSRWARVADRVAGR